MAETTPPSTSDGKAPPFLVEAIVAIVVLSIGAGVWAFRQKVQSPVVAAGSIADLGADAVTSPSGLRWKDIQTGSGPSPKQGQTVVVHYHGRLTDGSVFDSSRQRGEVFKFTLGVGQVIKGWDEGVASMKVGGVRRLVVPPHLGYGPEGSGAKIPGNSTLVFDVELLGLE